MSKKILLIIFSFFLFSCSPSDSINNNNIDFSDVLNDQNMSDSEKIIELKIKLSKQEDHIQGLQKDLVDMDFSFDSLKTSNESMKDYFRSQLDSLQLEQTMLVGPEFSNNIIKLYNKVNILEDRAFFMDSLYFELVTDMVLIENQISSMLSSIEEIEIINDDLNDNFNNKDNTAIDYNYEYKIAHQMYMSSNYQLSLEKFQFLLNNNISNDLADNCQFWVAQIFFIKDDYKRSIKEFNNVLNYDKSNKKIDALYKIGLCYIKLNNNDKAIEIFQEIINNYPKSKYYSKANEFILNLK